MTTEKEKETSRLDIISSQIQKERQLTAEEIRVYI